MNEWSFLCANSGNQSWQVWVSLRENTKMAESKMAKFHDGRNQDGCHHQVKWEWMSLSQIELVWVRVRVEWECFWVNLREDNKVSELKMAVSETTMAEFKTAVTSSSRVRMNEWCFFLCKMPESKMVELKMAAILKLSENEWVWVRMNEWSLFFQNGWIQEGRIQDGWHLQVEWECISLSQSFVQLVAESKMAVFKMAAIIKLSENEWVKFFLFKMAESKMAEFKMADIIKLGKNEWVWVRLN